MAHFCELDENNRVVQVYVIADEDCQDDNGNESEAVGIAFCESLFGADKTFKQTSYNGNLRKNFAGIGFTYDASRDAFIEDSPFPSWVLNETTCRYEAPLPNPSDPNDVNNQYTWDEEAWDTDTADPKTMGWVLTPVYPDAEE